MSDNRPSDEEIVSRWQTEVCIREEQVDPNSEFVWEGIWAGFVIGAGRPDLANHVAYRKFGFPREFD